VSIDRHSPGLDICGFASRTNDRQFGGTLKMNERQTAHRNNSIGIVDLVLRVLRHRGGHSTLRPGHEWSDVHRIRARVPQEGATRYLNVQPPVGVYVCDPTESGATPI